MCLEVRKDEKYLSLLHQPISATQQWVRYMQLPLEGSVQFKRHELGCHPGHFKKKKKKDKSKPGSTEVNGKVWIKDLLKPQKKKNCKVS